MALCAICRRAVSRSSLLSPACVAGLSQAEFRRYGVAGLPECCKICDSDALRTRGEGDEAAP